MLQGQKDPTHKNGCKKLKTIVFTTKMALRKISEGLVTISTVAFFASIRDLKANLADLSQVQKKNKSVNLEECNSTYSII